MARNRRLALALALTDDDENHVPTRLWVHDITRGRQQQGAYHHSPGALFRSMMRDLRRTVIGQLSKKRLTSGAFFNARCGRKKR